MRPKTAGAGFSSALAPYINAHVAEKQAMGCRYKTAIRILQRFDRFLVERNVETPNLERQVVEDWLERGCGESVSMRSGRVTCLRQLCLFLKHQGFSPFVPGRYDCRRRHSLPYVFIREEVQSLLTFMDNLQEDVRSPHRRVALGLIFRLLYGCGMRISEILHLNVDDVDLDAGILRVVDTKFRKDRLIPVSPSLAERLRAYADLCPRSRRPNDLFLSAPHGGPWSHGHIYIVFRQALWGCGISHTGRGPRIHDLRHTFACHRLGDWIRSGVDVDVALPVLSTYMGHESLYHTQRYLHFVADMYPDIVSKLDTRLSHSISRKGGAH